MIYIVATPIGNLEDITLRALGILKTVEYILCEDTRRTEILLKKYGIKTRRISFNEHNSKRKIPMVIKDLKSGKNIALVSNAGTPLISDPGFKLIKECLERGIKVTSVPGPSSVINALVLSGMPLESFYFTGFLPRKKGKRRKELEFIKKINTTTVLFESPERVKKLLEEIIGIMPDREVVMLREMTKLYEERIAGKPIEILKNLPEKVKGEIVLIIGKESHTSP